MRISLISENYLYLLLVLLGLTCSLTLKMEVVYSSETLINFYESTRHHIPQNITLDTYSCKNLKRDTRKLNHDYLLSDIMWRILQTLGLNL
jgi:hypothetical protein